MIDTIRKISEQDCQSGRKFCVVYLNLSISCAEVRMYPGEMALNERVRGEWRLGSLGCAENIALGGYHQSASSPTAESGHMIDYAENRESLLAAAREKIKELRAMKCNELRALAARLEELKVTVVS